MTSAVDWDEHFVFACFDYAFGKALIELLLFLHSLIFAVTNS